MANKPTRSTGRAPKAGSIPAQRELSLVLIDDNRLLREGLAAVVHDHPGFQVLAAAAADGSLQQVRELKPDLVLLDLGLGDRDPLDLTMMLRREAPEARVIIMGMDSTQEDVAAFVRAGASGFVLKDTSLEDFFSTMRRVGEGAEVLPPALTNSLFTQLAGHAAARPRARAMESVRLTTRERQVIALLAEGLSNKEIASRLHIAVYTVKSHVHNVLEKLALRSRLEVVAFTHAASSAAPSSG